MALVIENVTVERYGRRMVSEVSITVEPGKVAAVLGANGAGKSELVLAVAGVLPIISGNIVIDGTAIHRSAPDVIRRAGVAAVPEGHRVLSRLSVDDNLRAAGSVLSASEVETTLVDTYEVFPELGERKSQIAGTMSGGQQQMLAIGHALMSQPKYMLIDEMSLGLAPLIVKRLVDTVSQLVERGTGIVLVEQFTEVALSLADSVLVMRSGKVQFSGSAAEIRQDPRIVDEAYF